MIKQLRKVGNSNALLLDKPLLEVVGLEEGANVEITIDHGNIIISPVSPGQVSEDRATELLDKIVATRHDALKRLAQ
ncbi:MAG: AbrB/MazE/SpoVT family DNA-binding domain-containing protein [Planctomycetota bacterium]|jgi:antitoxin component of MazEF toxin-antitoxin module